MFIREWRGRANQAEAAKYPDYFRREVIRQLREAPGFKGDEAGDVSIGRYVPAICVAMLNLAASAVFAIKSHSSSWS